MSLPNKIPMLLMLPVCGIAVYFLGGQVAEIDSQIVSGSRNWILIHFMVYLANFVLAWFLRTSWPVTMGRMLVCGLFAYISISELIDLLGGYYGQWSQLLGGDGKLGETIVNAVRYTITAWMVSFVMMVVCIAVGFEAEDSSADNTQ